MAISKICIECNRHFIERNNENKNPICPLCKTEFVQKRIKELKKIENEKCKETKLQENKLFEEKLKQFNVIPLDSVATVKNQSLLVIGNGFDIMHGIKSSYYNFQKTLGKNSYLRFVLENYLQADDIWCDFENALGKINVGAMCNERIIDDYLEDCDAYDEEANASSFFMASEMAAQPIISIADELPKRFRSWIESLSVQTDDRPLKSIVSDTFCLNFNYTEFIETMYGVSEGNVCYIHGCRRKKKFHPKEKLVLGHIPGASDSMYDFTHTKLGKKSFAKKKLIKAAQENTISIVSQNDKELTKNSSEIIKANQNFFDLLRNISSVIIIGHSLSEVDYDYFREIIESNSSKDNINWYISAFCLRDLNNIAKFQVEMGIKTENLFIFRTDSIFVNVKPSVSPEPVLTKWKNLISIDDEKIIVKKSHNELLLNKSNSKDILYDCILPVAISFAFYIASYELLFVIARGSFGGIFLFRKNNDSWSFVGELESIPNQSLINRRLKKIYINRDEIIFVYNSRVRKYSLADSKLIYNKARQKAPLYEYQGEEITSKFL